MPSLPAGPGFSFPGGTAAGVDRPRVDGRRALLILDEPCAGLDRCARAFPAIPATSGRRRSLPPWCSSPITWRKSCPCFPRLDTPGRPRLACGRKTPSYLRRPFQASMRPAAEQRNRVTRSNCCKNARPHVIRSAPVNLGLDQNKSRPGCARPGSSRPPIASEISNSDQGDPPNMAGATVALPIDNEPIAIPPNQRGEQHACIQVKRRRQLHERR